MLSAQKTNIPESTYQRESHILKSDSGCGAESLKKHFINGNEHNFLENLFEIPDGY